MHQRGSIRKRSQGWAYASAAAIAALVALMAVPGVSWAAGSFPRAAGQHQSQHQAQPAPKPADRSPQRNGQNPRPQIAGKQNGAKQEHLAEWMSHHQNLTPEEQQKALEQEPGFSQLPAETQQRMRQRLQQLNNMSPTQRERVLDRIETMERLTPPQRRQVTTAMQQLGSLPQARRRMVSKAFRDLREMPPEQRQTELNSDQFMGQFSEQERGVLHNLLTVEPYLPAPEATSGTTSGTVQTDGRQ